MRKANNLNQLLSRVKSIFGRKAISSTTVPPNAEPPTDLSVVSDPRLRAAFADIEKYLGENYGTPTAKLSYQDYANGASFFSKDAVFAPSLVILTDSDGLYNLPDNVMMLVSITSTKMRTGSLKNWVSSPCSSKDSARPTASSTSPSASPRTSSPIPRPSRPPM